MPGLIKKAVHALTHHSVRIPRKARTFLGPKLIVEELNLVSTAGYQIFGKIYRPAENHGLMPGVLLCPGIDDPGSVFEHHSTPVSADEIAQLGAVALWFDPAGRGRSWGEEDFGGVEHQDNVRVALRYLLSRPYVVPERSGVVSISLGISMAAGALSYRDCPIGWLIDWEGPSDREIITAFGKIMLPANGHNLDDDRYWHPREAIRHIGNINCGYFRFQAVSDHAQPGEFRHTHRMINAASEGSLPWFQLNDHPRNTIPQDPRWYPSGYPTANRILLDKIRELAALE